MATDNPMIVTAAVGAVQNNLNKIGLALPPDLNTALEELTTTKSRLSEHTSDRHDLVEAVYAALAADKDPAKDKTVQENLARTALRGYNIGKELNDREGRERVRLMRQHADSIIESMRPHVADADAALADVRDQLAPITVDTPVHHVPHSLLGTWGRGREALDTLNSVLAAWTALYRVTTGEVSPTHRALILAPLTPDQVAALPNRDRADLAGVPLDLATTDQYAQRVKAYRQAQEDTREARKEAAREARKTGGYGAIIRTRVGHT